MKALTISQPYASLIAYGDKWVENRRWGTNYRGLLLIHAGKGTQYLDLDEMREQNLPTGAVVAVAMLSACMPLASMRAMNAECRVWSIKERRITIRDVLEHEHTEGPWCWVLTGVLRVPKPVPCKGAQGLWVPPQEVCDAIDAQLNPAPSPTGTQ